MFKRPPQAVPLTDTKTDAIDRESMAMLSAVLLAGLAWAVRWALAAVPLIP